MQCPNTFNCCVFSLPGLAVKVMGAGSGFSPVALVSASQGSSLPVEWEDHWDHHSRSHP